MTKLQLIELCCPVCDNHFRSRAVASADAPACQRTDFQEESPGRPALSFQIHMCDKCGFSGGEREFTDPIAISRVVIDHVWSELAPNIADGCGAASEKYEAAAKVAEWRGDEWRQVAELWLRAAWCCVDEGDVEAERYFRRKAAWSFEAALSFDGVAAEDRALLTYLTGELWRRIGDLRQAREWFQRVPREVIDLGDQEWLIESARQQHDAPRDWFE